MSQASEPEKIASEILGAILQKYYLMHAHYFFLNVKFHDN